MQTALAPADQAFVEAVQAFIAAHWRPLPERQVAGAAGQGVPTADPRERAWFDALVVQGWSVPAWPREHGGTDWSARWLYLWRRELALAGAPELDEWGVEWAGPALWGWGDAGQQRRFLPAIRAADERWCLGFAEPEAGADVAAIDTRAHREPGGYRLGGVKGWVAGAARARWMLTAARSGSDSAGPDAALSLFVVDLAAPGVTVQPFDLLGGLPGVARVRLDGVRVPQEQRIGAEGAALDIVRALEARAQRRFEPAAALRVLAGQLAEAAQELPGDDGSLAEDPGFARKLAELAVDLAGLEALEQREVWEMWERSPDRDLEIAPTTTGRDLEIAPTRTDRDLEIAPTIRGRDLEIAPTGRGGAARALALRLRHTQISQRIGELFVEALGYYSLPYPDPVSIDNEGPIGHHYALAALRGMFARRLPPADDGHGEGLRDRIAHQLFGY